MAQASAFAPGSTISPKALALVLPLLWAWCTLQHTFAMEGAMNSTDLILWFPRWAWVTLQEAGWNYLLFWIPLGLGLLVVKAIYNSRK